MKFLGRVPGQRLPLETQASIYGENIVPKHFGRKLRGCDQWHLVGLGRSSQTPGLVDVHAAQKRDGLIHGYEPHCQRLELIRLIWGISRMQNLNGSSEDAVAFLVRLFDGEKYGLSGMLADYLVGAGKWRQLAKQDRFGDFAAMATGEAEEIQHRRE
jgi:hypothetical protein